MKLNTIVLLLTCGYISGVMAGQSIPEPPKPAPSKGKLAHHQASTHQQWTTYPVIEENRFSSRKRAVFIVQNLEAEFAQVFPPMGAGNFPDKFAIKGEGKAYQETLKKGRFAVTPKGRGNYYWVMAKHETAEQVSIANSVRYFTAPGPAPTEMLKVTKSRLQIVPEPLPREHWRYREGETWQFKLSFDGKALPDTAVRMETEQGTKRVFESDDNGVVSIVFPRDIGELKTESAGSHHGAPKSKFVLVVNHRDAGKAYQTTFNYQYAASAMRGKSLAAGFGFMAFGGLLALPLLRRTKAKKKGNSHV